MIANKTSFMLSGVYKQIYDQCTLDGIRCLLRQAQLVNDVSKKEINLGRTKSDALRYLRLAVDRGFLTFSDVQDFLRSAEEHGNQAILLLVPPASDSSDSTSPVASMVRSAVAAALFPDEQISSTLPKHEYPKEGYELVDFRNAAQQGIEWLAKAYGKEIKKVYRDVQPAKEVSTGIYREVREWTLVETRGVLIAAWRPNWNLLEIRVDLSDLPTPKALLDRQREMKMLIRGAIDVDELPGLPIDEVLNDLVYERKRTANQGRYRISRIQLEDPRSGKNTFRPLKSEDFDNDSGRSKMLEEAQRRGWNVHGARIDWLPIEGVTPDSFTERVTTYLEKTEEGSELRIQKRVSCEVYEYILSQIVNRGSRHE